MSGDLLEGTLLVDGEDTKWLRCALALDASQAPFPWQLDLLRRFRQGEIVSSLDIPTGLGKTAVMAVWLVARAIGSALPRRLVYVVDRRAVDQATEVAESPHELKYLRQLDTALEGFHSLRAGSAGLFTLYPTVNGNDEEDTFFGCSRVWKSVTPYVVTRHAKGEVAAEALAADLLGECRRLELPEPRVKASSFRGVPGIGLTGYMTLTFERSIEGPILLGRTRHLGGGLFRPVQERPG